MPGPSPSAAHALATALSTPVVRGLVDGGFATFAPHLRAVDEQIRLGVRLRTAPPTMEMLLGALRRRRVAEPRDLHVVADTDLEHQATRILVFYRDRCGALCAEPGPLSAADRADPFTVATHLTERIHPDEITDAEAADKFIDRFLRDLASSRQV